MSELDDITAQLPVEQIAGLLGTDKATTQQVIQAALPSLLAGLQHNVQSPAGAAALQGALAQHRNNLLDGGVDAAAVDTADGSKIVNHVLGDRQETLVSQLNAATPPDFDLGGLVRKVLPILAPIVMAYLAKRFGAGGAPDAQAAGTGGPDLGGLLGGLLGGIQHGAAGSTAGGVDLGGLLGGLFGGR